MSGLRRDFKIYFFKIKKNWLIYSIILVGIYLIIFPLCLLKTINQFDSSAQSNILFFVLMQKFIHPLLIIGLHMFTKEYVNRNYKDIIYSVDIGLKCRHFLFFWIYFIITIIPLFITVCAMISGIMPYLFIFVVQSFVLICIYYFFSMVVKSELLALSIVMFYILIFTFLYTDSSILNIFLFNSALLNFESPFIYIAECLVSSLFLLSTGVYFEKRK